MSKYDFLIKGGNVFNEEKKDFQVLDIGIKDERIKKIGKIENREAKEIINAEGKYICPGFIDLTNHSDTFWTIFNDPFQQSLIYQGVTTIIGGNCGSSLAPIMSPENIKNIQKWTDISNININWQSMAEFLTEIENYGLGVNFGTLVGHGVLRRGIIGDKSRPAAKAEIEKMKTLLQSSLNEGAYGVSFNLASSHEKESDEWEIIELSKIASLNNGVVKHHLEDEGKNILPALSRFMGYARQGGAKTQISHFKAVGKSAWDKFGDSLSIIENALRAEIPVTLDIFPYTKTGSSLYLLLPSWARENGKDGILNLLKDEIKRKNIIEYLKEITLHYDKIIIASTLNDKSAVGKTLDELSKITGIPPYEVMLNLLEINNLNVSIFNDALNESNIFELAKKPYSMIASDGAGYDLLTSDSADKYADFKNYIHPRSFGAFTKAIKEFSLKNSILTLGEAVYKMSSMPARFLGLEDRGALKENFIADISVIDINSLEDKANYDNPFQFSKGTEWVFVNGAPAIREGKLSFTRAGKVLRKK